MNKIKIIALLSVVLSLCSCAKIVAETDIVIDSKIQDWGLGEIKLNPNIVSYLFDADTAQYYFGSFEEARKGVIRLKWNNEIREAFLEGVYDPIIERMVFEDVKQISGLCVVCDTLKSIYYYKNIKVVPNLITLYLPLTIKPWMFTPEKREVKEGGWVGIADVVAPTPSVVH